MKKNDNNRSFLRGFTLVEIIMIVVIIGIIGLLAVPMIGSAAPMQLRAAANKVAADLEYAKSMAISRQRYYSVEFNDSNETYYISNSTTPRIDDPMTGKDYLVNFSADSRISNVDIDSVDFDSQSSITFDYLGSPFAGVGTSSDLIDGTAGITLTAGNAQIKVLVEPVTGFVSIEE